MNTIKSCAFVVLLIWTIKMYGQQLDASPNIIILTSDGLRWQEIFGGMDTGFISETSPHLSCETLQKFRGDTPEERRKKLMPFVWNLFAGQGRLIGNRTYENKMDTKNFHRFSYPGYNEMFSGIFDPFVSNNKKNYNKNHTILEELNKTDQYKNKIAAFASWEVFPYILNEPRSGILVNAGWEQLTGPLSANLSRLNKGNLNPPAWKGETRYDDLTWNMAVEYLKSNHPKVLFISLDDTDRFGHKGDYWSYLEAIHQWDTYLRELWDIIQLDSFYAGNTYMLMTTDHGRGTTSTTWSRHGLLPVTSGETWLMEYGPTVVAEGEVKTPSQEYLSTVAYRIAQYTKSNYRSFTYNPEMNKSSFTDPVLAGTGKPEINGKLEVSTAAVIGNK